MAASIAIEEESGTSSGWIHPHNGYYAGDFSTVPYQAPDLRFLFTVKEYAA